MSQDICFCQSDCKNTTCKRHKDNIDWEIPKHKYYGASMSDFSNKCDNYVKADEG